VGVLISDEVNYRRQHSFIIKTTQKYTKKSVRYGYSGSFFMYHCVYNILP